MPSEHEDEDNYHSLPPWNGRRAELFRNLQFPAQVERKKNHWLASETEMSSVGTLTEVAHDEFHREFDQHLENPPWTLPDAGHLTPFTEVQRLSLCKF